MYIVLLFPRIPVIRRREELFKLTREASVPVTR